MLKNLIKYYFLISIPLFAFALPTVGSNNFPILLLNFSYFLLYYVIIHNNYTGNHSISISKQFIIVSFIGVVAFNIFSFVYNKDFFVFSAADASVYDWYSAYLSDLSFSDAISWITKNLSIDDAGQFIFVSTVYRLIPSNLLVNLAFIILGLISAKHVYHICVRFMSAKYAKICALSFALSSYMIFYYSSGLKESIMIFLIVTAFDNYYKFQFKPRLKYAISMVLSAAGLIFFRPVIMFFFIGAVAITSLLQIKYRPISFVLVIITIIAVYLSSSLFMSNFNRFTNRGNIGEVNEEMVRGSKQFTFSVNSLAQAAGPFPTVRVFDDKVMLSLFSSGLIFRVLLAFPFWMGFFFIFKKRIKLLYPPIFFILFEMGSLFIIIEGLELRKSLPHLPLVYIISFWFLYNYDNRILPFFKKKYFKLFQFWLFIAFGLILFWNLR